MLIAWIALALTGALSSAHAAVFAVTNTTDASPGSLRDAITQSNANGAVADTITFAGSLSGKSIPLSTPLPALTGGNLTIDGDLNNDGVPDVSLDGAVVSGNGLTIRSEQNVIVGLRIARFDGAGIALDRLKSVSNTVAGCFIGTNKAGTLSLANGHGILVTGLARGTQIGGTTPRDRNLISGNHRAGILVAGANDTTILRNLIGTDITGKIPLSNGAGIIVSDSENCRIGNGTAAGRNVISANRSQSLSEAPQAVLPFEPGGIIVLRGGNHAIRGNYIGTVASGASSLANSFNGLLLRGTSGVVVGGTTAGAGNVIGDRLTIDAAQSASVLGNNIGVNATGKVLLGQFTGITLSDTVACTIGGTSASARNVIAGIPSTVAVVSGGRDNALLGNYVGLTRDGTKVLGGAIGIQVRAGALNTRIGSSQAGSGNVVAGMTSNAIRIEEATGTVIARNRIGFLGTGTPVPLPNSASILFTGNGPTSTLTIGGKTSALGNDVAVGLSGFGVAVQGRGPCQVLNNRIGSGVANQLAAGSTGVALAGAGASPRVAGNTISEVNTGIQIFGSGSAPVVTRNAFSFYQQAAIAIGSDAQPNLGDLGNASTTDDGANVFTHTLGTLDVQNGGPKDIKAEGNNWNGQTVAATIATFITDKNDNPAFGLVDFSPLLGGIIPTAAGVSLASAQLTGLAAIPTARGAEVTFTLSAPASVAGEVLNLAGRPVALLPPHEGQAGLNRLAWSGLTSQGLHAPNGAYLIRLSVRAPSGAQSSALASLALHRD